MKTLTAMEVHNIVDASVDFMIHRRNFDSDGNTLRVSYPSEVVNSAKARAVGLPLEVAATVIEVVLRAGSKAEVLGTYRTT